MSARLIRAALFAFCLLFTGCHSRPISSPSVSANINPHDAAIRANQLFLSQKTFDPWILTRTGLDYTIPAYEGNNGSGRLIGPNGRDITVYQAGHYVNGRLTPTYQYHLTAFDNPALMTKQILDMYRGMLLPPPDGPASPVELHNIVDIHWPGLWQRSDIVIDGDPEAQQITHANLFYLLSSTFPKSTDSLPPMGLSSDAYGGHIFWDADVWMLPALIVQHPEYAKPIVDYRFKLLGQARKNAKQHGYLGAEFPWESADTGKEEAPPEFAQERHITADVAFAAWQFYLWTGDKDYLTREGWPLLQATAQYWTSRVKRGTDGKYHIYGVLSPDETAGVVDDDAYTNVVVKYNLLAALAAARTLRLPTDPRWSPIADAIFIPVDAKRGIIAENARPLTDRFQGKQADTLLLVHPLGFTTDGRLEGRMLDYYSAHTIPTGPAMTSSIESIVAARLGRTQQALDLFRESYRPFERGPWDAFSEKRTTNNVYFLTGMAGCVQSVLYGFAGLQIVSPWEHGTGKKLLSDKDAALYCSPHLPPGWGTLIIKGVRFHGRTLNITISPDNAVTVTPVSRRTEALA